ncbi:putative IS-element [Desulfosarcina variabilis str. Montpellier]|uniref:transposase n=1 Tax=Desulfosarcina variabilis TaxID=2300 RepID=UPI003AFAC847
MVDDIHKCPRCGSTAFYRYGRAKNGKQRHICLICNRQYVVKRRQSEMATRPVCPICNEPMHVYRRETNAVRYRCRNYPACRKFVKITLPQPAPASDHA